MHRVFSNSKQYNERGSDYYRCAIALEKFFVSLMSDAGLEQNDSSLSTTDVIVYMVDILWRVGRERERAIVALPPAALQHRSTAQLPSRSYTPDHITEQVQHNTLCTYMS